MIEFKFSDFLAPWPILRTYALLRRSEHWSAERMTRYQSEKLAAVLRYCGEEVPFYRDLFPKIGLRSQDITPENAKESLKLIPVLGKDQLRQSPALFLADHAERYRPKAITTSGTTGTPLTVYWDRGSNIMELCCMQRFWRWAGFHVGQSFLDLRSRMFMPEDKHVVHGDGITYIRNWKVNALEFSSDMIDESNVKKYYEVLEHYRPRLVRGHPQAIQHLAALLDRVGLRGWRPKVITPTSEALYEFQRRQISELWGAPILDHYGLKEHNAFAAQCLEGGYHIFPEYGIFEIVDDDGRAVEPGVEGWIVATGLHNFAQPLLRYNTRDRAVASVSGVCRCGRTLPCIDRLVGRIDDCVYTADGKRYSGLHFAFFGRRGIVKGRIIQDNTAGIRVELVTTSEFDATEQATLQETLMKKLDGKLAVDIQRVPEIVQETPGKFKFVVCKLDRKPG